ncbi:unnamed protein product [Kuraishia capsulata CBS 1993]|uniref:alpha-L-rhamnosidase n=1 Tax=Kuraishia capsulata CBS 1993 TaxID=1382522 RepID=W6MPX3_9ASCO|nr:uncharacterized protein KUCA_T00004759001 [Kuraishia capsulata CBS 1993]CDK28774.1 unnamed protein product [Kuraishia capsulata CBS 1993]
MVEIKQVKLDLLTPGKELGVLDNPTPKISWELVGTEKNWLQGAYQIRFKLSNGAIVNFSAVKSEKSTFVDWPWEDKKLTSKQQFGVSVRVASSEAPDQFSEWSDFFDFQVGILPTDTWEPKFIALKDQETALQEPPETLFRKEFHSAGDIVSAKVYSTALGAYEVEINGSKISTDYLAPGWTSYHNRLLHQVYDVSEFLTKGDNAIGARVSAGWWSGHLGFEGGRSNIYGTKRAISLLLEIVYTDKTVKQVITDESWQSSSGPIVMAELYDGETYDARLEQDGWSSPKFEAKNWSAVDVVEFSGKSILPQSFPYIRCVDTLQPQELITTPTGKKIFDFGVNMVGFVRVKKTYAPESHTIVLRHAEVLEKGELGVRPLRLAKATDSYTFSGKPEGEEWTPRFTSHGFRYCEVNNWYGELTKDSVEFVVISTDMTPTGTFDSSNTMVNKLHANAIRSMRGNFVGLPTDCPQRDERLGWTGDISQFAPTACFLFDCAPLLRNWLQDLFAEQKENNGVPPLVVPDIVEGLFTLSEGCAIWQDAAMLVPEALYEEYSDPQILEEQFQSMVDWIKALPKLQDKVLWREVTIQLGDWLDPTAPPDNPLLAMTDARLVADAYLYKILTVLIETSKTLGKSKELEYYTSMAEKCKKDFADEYLTVSGRSVSDTQCAYALAICFDLYADQNQVDRAGKRLAEIVRKGKFKIGSGFAGTPYITKALTKTGNSDFAYKLLLQTECPSWLYAVSMGATTIWERYDSMLPDGSINPGDMTSFNHYALGSVASWMHSVIGGLSKSEPGWKTFKVEPILGGGFTHTKVTHRSPYGLISVSWKLDGLDFSIEVTVPLNSSAEIVLPNGEKNQVGSGTWSFSCVLKEEDLTDKVEQAEKDDVSLRF